MQVNFVPPNEQTAEMPSVWPLGSFLLKRYNIFYEGARQTVLGEGGKSAFRLHASCLLCVLNALHKPLEKKLPYLFVGKLLTGLFLAKKIMRYDAGYS